MKKNHLILIAIVFTLTGCYSAVYKYKAEKTKGVDFKKYKTYAFTPTRDTSFKKMVDKKKLERALAAVAIKELTDRGMVLDTLNPDCLFTYTLVMKESYDVGQKPPEIYNVYSYAAPYPGQNQIYYYRADYGLPPTYSGGLDVTTFRDGSLVIDMIDRQTNQVIWRSSAQGKTTEQERKGVKTTVDTVVPPMFKKFPVKQN